MAEVLYRGRCFGKSLFRSCFSLFFLFLVSFPVPLSVPRSLSFLSGLFVLAEHFGGSSHPFDLPGASFSFSFGLGAVISGSFCIAHKI